MAVAKPHADIASNVHDALHSTVGVYHERLHEITRQEEKLKLQRAILKATAMAHLTQAAPNLKLSSDIVGRVSTFNW